MNKMTKGALATGLGATLLLGSGGSLAVWNSTAEAPAGSIVTGDLKLTAGTGIWTNSLGTIDLSTYKVVPGDTLTFTQPVDVVLEGDRMEAKLTLTDNLTTAASYLQIGPTTLTDSTGASIATLTDGSDGTYTAKVDVTFLPETSGTAGTNSTNDLGKIGFKLEQTAASTQL